MNMYEHSPCKPSSYNELKPTIHWAQRHERDVGIKWCRRIYDFQLLHVAHGNIRVTVGDREAALSSGQTCLIPSRERHSVEVMSQPAVSLLGIHFDFFGELRVTKDEDIIVVESHAEDRPYCAMPIIDASAAIPVFSQTGLTPAPIIRLMEDAIAEWNDRKPGYEAVCRGLMLQAITLLSRSTADNQRSAHPKYESRITQLAEDIEAGCERKWTLADMAGYVNVHEDYLGRLFKNQLGVGPNRYLQAARHKKARQLLRETSLSVEEVALASGYADLHYFSRIFRKWEGLSPMQFRKLSRML
ncbi:MAG: AraC family transcriptional regulator [Paenibacillus sp.]|nr:AraC family transcriptional regulator [Paenibacillus sp.]